MLKTLTVTILDEAFGDNGRGRLFSTTQPALTDEADNVSKNC